MLLTILIILCLFFFGKIIWNIIAGVWELLFGGYL